MRFSPKPLRAISKTLPLRGAWTVIGTLSLIGLFSWTTWQTHRLDQLRSERYALEEECVYLEQMYRDAQQEWFAETSLERVISRAKSELSLVDASPHTRTVLALGPTEPVQSRAGEWLSELAGRFDRFGEIRSAHAHEAGQ